MIYLNDLSLTSQNIQINELLKAIETSIPATEIEKTISINKAKEEINRFLLAHWVVESKSIKLF